MNHAATVKVWTGNTPRSGGIGSAIASVRMQRCCGCHSL
jgi:hypothetical protein